MIHSLQHIYILSQISRWWNQLTLVCLWGCSVIWSSLSSRHRAQWDDSSLLPIRNSRWLEIPKGQSSGRWVCLLGWKYSHINNHMICFVKSLWRNGWTWKTFSNVGFYAMNAKLIKIHTCVGPYMLKGIPWMSSSMKVSNLEKFVLGLTFD